MLYFFVYERVYTTVFFVDAAWFVHSHHVFGLGSDKDTIFASG